MTLAVNKRPPSEAASPIDLSQAETTVKGPLVTEARHAAALVLAQIPVPGAKHVEKDGIIQISLGERAIKVDKDGSLSYGLSATKEFYTKVEGASEQDKRKTAAHYLANPFEVALPVAALCSQIMKELCEKRGTITGFIHSYQRLESGLDIFWIERRDHSELRVRSGLGEPLNISAQDGRIEMFHDVTLKEAVDSLVSGRLIKGAH